MSKNIETGSLDVDYAEGREKNKALSYRLRRRTKEAIKCIDAFNDKKDFSLLDLGTADGRMMKAIKDNYSLSNAKGVEYSFDLVQYALQKYTDLDIIQGDMQDLSFIDEDKVYDIVLATAVIEHVPHPSKVFEQVYSRLTAGGLFILTSPDPFWEEVASFVGHLKEDQHFDVMSLKKLNNIAVENNFEVLKSEKFMFSPVGFPFEEKIEKLLRFLKLNFLMANQVICCKKNI